MGKILKAFVTDQIHIDAIAEKYSPEHKKFYEKSCELCEELEKKLNDDEKKMLDELMEAMFNDGACYAEEKFIRGYKLGVLITAEVYQGQDDFLGIDT